MAGFFVCQASLVGEAERSAPGSRGDSIELCVASRRGVRLPWYHKKLVGFESWLMKF
jgi:hypothetical protein